MMNAVAGVVIKNKNGDVVRTSKNLACIMMHARNFLFGTKLRQEGYTLPPGVREDVASPELI
ncbi:hypothetical protein [Ferrovum myxofaciens]|uniref:Uncharacterized protein n=1 Tax=Ferrovum myxofaciens TaxID=416213 RepID=A0A9E6MYE7_9PROT|nr:hypothetical protein [Ferrovum myxofaciens]QKE37351.1 MAG: hypothetical protein HO273_00275 [Ferrovum myxofaciens]QWY75007.1 MAG: hypothetical protein JVY19_00750 [Ferrovum myxofaciens]QWY77748.1 MAG: hypothetical protein JZL65_01280 [Ferrovum myxofaciens]